MATLDCCFTSLQKASTAMFKAISFSCKGQINKHTLCYYQLAWIVLHLCCTQHDSFKQTFSKLEERNSSQNFLKSHSNSCFPLQLSQEHKISSSHNPIMIDQSKPFCLTQYNETIYAHRNHTPKRKNVWKLWKMSQHIVRERQEKS